MSVSRASAAWTELQRALAGAEPNCRNDDRFTADTDEHDGELSEVCAGCPVLSQCRAWGMAAPEARRFGYFGGLSRRGRAYRPRDAAEARQLTG